MTRVIGVSGRVAYTANMPIPLGGLSSRATSSEPDDLLRECHERIRQHMRGAVALAAAREGDAAIAPTAAGVHRYFAVALPLHSQDEDESIGPRLAAAVVQPAYAQSVRNMTGQHVAIHAVLDRLLPMWDRLAHDPAALGALRDTLADDTRRLDALWGEHLALEERVVFPLIARMLDAATRATIVREMRARRVPPR